MIIEKIWFALVVLKPLKGNEIVPTAKGASVNVACISENEESLIKTLHKNFKYHKFKIIEILDIESEETFRISKNETSEKLELLNEIKEGYRFAWGKFYFTEV